MLLCLVEHLRITRQADAEWLKCRLERAVWLPGTQVDQRVHAGVRVMLKNAFRNFALSSSGVSRVVGDTGDGTAASEGARSVKGLSALISLHICTMPSLYNKIKL